jgi:pyridoxamine 5'-phosphate oxidase family protein
MTMTFTQAEAAYLQTPRRLGRLATVRPDGTPQVNPVGFSCDAERGTIDIGGFAMSSTRKYRNVAGNGHAAIVVDDIVSMDPWRVRFLEIRGTAEAIGSVDGEVAGRGDGAVIRIHPRRIISFGIEEPVGEPHQMRSQSRDVT